MGLGLPRYFLASLTAHVLVGTYLNPFPNTSPAPLCKLDFQLLVWGEKTLPCPGASEEVKAQILKLAGNLLTQDIIQEFHLY